MWANVKREDEWVSVTDPKELAASMKNGDPVNVFSRDSMELTAMMTKLAGKGIRAELARGKKMDFLAINGESVGFQPDALLDAL